MARGRADIANTALRIFLQEMGEAYDVKRGLKPYDGKKHFLEVRRFFSERCCYCGTEIQQDRYAQDHLIPMNKTYLGLHAWGNVVPACQDCNARKQGKEWHAYLVQCAGPNTAERYASIERFVKEHKYAPDLNHLKTVAEDLYAEVGRISMALIEAKIERLQKAL